MQAVALLHLLLLLLLYHHSQVARPLWLHLQTAALLPAAPLLHPAIAVLSSLYPSLLAWSSQQFWCMLRGISAPPCPGWDHSPSVPLDLLGL